MPKILPQPPATDPNLAAEARDAAQRLVKNNLDVDEKINLDSKLQPENPYKAAYRKTAPWSQKYRR